MGNIGGEIATGAASALFGIITHVPLAVWVILMGGLLIFGTLMRYLTNIKVDIALVTIFVGLSLVIYYRGHWIDMGYNQALVKLKAAQAEVAAYKRTNGMIQACYAQNGNTSFLWDRTQGKCLRADGALQ